MFTKTDGKQIAKVDKDLHCFYPIAKQQGLQKRCEPVVKQGDGGGGGGTFWSLYDATQKKNCNDAVPNISFNLKSHHDQQLTSIWASFFGMLCHRRWFFPITFIRVFLYKKPHNIGETVPIIKTPQKKWKKKRLNPSHISSPVPQTQLIQLIPRRIWSAWVGIKHHHTISNQTPATNLGP